MKPSSRCGEDASRLLETLPRQMDAAPSLASDAALPGAWLLRDTRALAERLDLPRERIRRIDSVAYRPESRAVVRVDLGPERPALYLKLLTKTAFDRAARTLAAIGDGGPELRLGLPLLSLREESVLVTEEMAGRSLHELLCAGDLPDENLLARGIDAFAATMPRDELPTRSIADERDATIAMLDRGGRLVPAMLKVRDLVQDIAPPPTRPSSTVHSHLDDKRIFIDRDSVGLIDLEGASRGDPLLDQINLVEHCRLRAMQSAAQSAGGVLASQLIRHWRLDCRDHALLCQGLVRARLAGEHALRPGSGALAERLAREATAFLQPGA